MAEERSLAGERSLDAMMGQPYNDFFSPQTSPTGAQSSQKYNSLDRQTPRLKEPSEISDPLSKLREIFEGGKVLAAVSRDFFSPNTSPRNSIDKHDKRFNMTDTKK